MTKKNYEEIKKWMENEYGVQPKCTIKEYTGYMYGTSECWEVNEFVQYFLTEEALYKFYYEVPEDETDLSNLDYDNPYRIEDVDAQYWIDFVI